MFRSNPALPPNKRLTLLISLQTNRGHRHMNRRFLLAALIILPLLLLSSPPASGRQPMAPSAYSVADPLVLAFYYPWFDESAWTYDRLSDLPAEPYVSSDRVVMGRQIDQAKAAGIDAFVVAWYGPGGGNQTETNLTALLEEAAARDFRIAVLFETTSPFFAGLGDVASAMQHLSSVHMNQPAYLRVDGRPVVFFWRPTLYAIDSWRSIRDQVDAGYNQVWISEGVDTSYLQLFDGHHLYSNTWNPPADLNAVNAKYSQLVRDGSSSYGSPKLWVATVMPGYNDTRIRGGGFAQDRGGGAYFDQSWQAAINSQPQWILINSFNEWPEGSYIEPSAAYGDLYIRKSAEWSAAFKGGATPAVSAASFQPSPPATQPTPRPEVTRPTAFVTASLLNLRSGPDTEYDVVGMVSVGQALPIIGRAADVTEWIQVEYDSERVWLHTDFVDIVGPLDQIPFLDSEVSTTVDGSNTSLPAHALSFGKVRPYTVYRTR